MEGEKMAVKNEAIGNDSSHGKALKPSTIMHLVYGVYPSFAMLAGMQLDLFTALSSKALTAKSLAGSLGVLEDQITPLLYSLVAAVFWKWRMDFSPIPKKPARFWFVGVRTTWGR